MLYSVGDRVPPIRHRQIFTKAVLDQHIDRPATPGLRAAGSEPRPICWCWYSLRLVVLMAHELNHCQQVSRGPPASAFPTERTVTEILRCVQEEVGTPTRGPAAGWRLRKPLQKFWYPPGGLE